MGGVQKSVYSGVTEVTELFWGSKKTMGILGNSLLGVKWSAPFLKITILPSLFCRSRLRCGYNPPQVDGDIPKAKP